MEPNPISQALVEAKNRALVKSDAHLRDVRRAAQRDAAADRGEIEKLTERLYQEHDSAIHQLRSAVSAIEEKSTNDIDCFNVESRCNLGQTKKNIDELLEVRKENQRLEQKLKEGEGALSSSCTSSSLSPVARTERLDALLGVERAVVDHACHHLVVVVDAV